MHACSRCTGCQTRCLAGRLQADTLHRETSEGESVEALPGAWPEQGRVTYADVRLRYHRDAPLALNGLSLDIRPGQKLGICGRTGAFLTVFRCSALLNDHVVQLTGAYLVCSK